MPADAEPFLLRPRDPLIVRDARPFAAEPGARAVSLPWPLPGTVAGALRGHVAPSLGLAWADSLTEIALTGYLRVVRHSPADRWTAYVPAPRDAVPYTEDDARTLMRLRPLAGGALPAGAGWTSPDAAGAVAPLSIGADVKPDPGLDDWSFAAVLDWLASPDSTDRPLTPDSAGRAEEVNALPKLPTETRTHVKIDYARGAAETGFLFSTEGLAFLPAPRRLHPETAILCRLGLPGGRPWSPAPAFLALGGERRQTMLDPIAAEETPDPDPFAAPKGWPERVASSEAAARGRLRLLLVTPAFFDAGWLPGGLGGDGPLSQLLGGARLTLHPTVYAQHGTTADSQLLGGARLTLHGAAVERRVPVSGWDLVRRAPKPLRYAAPAGSVYFFELGRPLTAADFTALWMRPVSDQARDRIDGYGLALPGIWDPVSAGSDA